ncbi:MAG: rod shape-determining protein RodA [Methyloprofundus sp.]|nr:rod shape-determining protein RodA [Methyloprofundus sp.]
MKVELRPEQFKEHSLLGRLLRRLHIDIPLLIGLLMLLTISFMMLYSTGNKETALLVRQAVRMGIAGVLMIVLAHIDPRQFQRYSIPLYVVGVGLLAAVLLVGDVGKGAQRWLDLGFFRFQPSEMIKITTPMMLAWYLSGHDIPPRWYHIVTATAFILLPTLLIVRQPDLGTSLLVASSGVFVLYFAGISWRFLLSSAASLMAFTPVYWHFFMREYQKDRVLTFLNPEADPMGKGYHIIQSKIAIGSGGVNGKGWQENTQSQLDFLPESSTDFIFAVFAEEFGLVGCIGLLALYLAIIARGFYIAVQAQDTYCRLLAGSLVCTFFVYIFVNIGMVIGVLPVVGVPLPLISYGGTSMVTLLAGFGILMSIHTHKKILPS